MPEDNLDAECARLAAIEAGKRKARREAYTANETPTPPGATNGNTTASVKQVTEFMRDEYGLRLNEAIMLIEHRRDLMNTGIARGLLTRDVAEAIWKGENRD